MGLIFWLVQSGKLQLSFVEEVIRNNPWRIVSALLFILVDQVFVAIRLRIIMMTKIKETLSLLKVILINWIGIFFNAVLPGAVTGDLVKIFYLHDLNTNLPKKFLFLGVFMDRLLGLIGLVSIGGLFSIFNYSALTQFSPEVTHLVHTNLLMILGFILAAIFFFFFSQVPLNISKKLQALPIFNKVMPLFDHIWNTFILFKPKIGILFFYSLVVQFFALVIFWYLVSPFAQGEALTFAKTATIMPIGFISIALPIAPAGLGVGHAVFESLLGFYGVTNGANLFNLYFLVVMLTNLTGAIPYIMYSSNKKLDLERIQQDN